MGCGSSTAVSIQPYFVPQLDALCDPDAELEQELELQEKELMYERLPPSMAAPYYLKRIGEDLTQYTELIADTACPNALVSTLSVYEEEIMQVMRNFAPEALSVRFHRALEAALEDKDIPAYGFLADPNEAVPVAGLVPSRSWSQLVPRDAIALALWLTSSRPDCLRPQINKQLDALYPAVHGKPSSARCSVAALLSLLATVLPDSQSRDALSEQDAYPTVLPSGTVDPAVAIAASAYLGWRDRRYEQLEMPALADVPAAAHTAPADRAAALAHEQETKRAILAHCAALRREQAWRDANAGNPAYLHGVHNVYHDLGIPVPPPPPNTDTPPPPPPAPPATPLPELPRLAGSSPAVALGDQLQSLLLSADWAGLHDLLAPAIGAVVPVRALSRAMAGLGLVASVEHRVVDVGFTGHAFERQVRKRNGLAEDAPLLTARDDRLDYTRFGHLLHCPRTAVAHLLYITSHQLFVTVRTVMLVVTDSQHAPIAVGFPAPLALHITHTPAAETPVPAASLPLRSVPKPLSEGPRRFALVSDVASLAMRSLSVTYTNASAEDTLVGVCLPPLDCFHSVTRFSLTSSSGAQACTLPDLHPHAAAGAGAHLLLLSGSATAQLSVEYTTAPLRLVFGTEAQIEQLGGDAHSPEETRPPRFADTFDQFLPLLGQDSPEFAQWLAASGAAPLPDVYGQHPHYAALCEAWAAIPAHAVVRAATQVCAHMAGSLYLHPHAGDVTHVGHLVSGAAAAPNTPTHASCAPLRGRLPCSQAALVLVFAAAMRALRVPCRLNRGMGYSACELLVPRLGWVSADPALLAPHNLGQVHDSALMGIVGRPPLVDAAILLAHTAAGQARLEHVRGASQLLVTLCLALQGCQSAWVELAAPEFRARCNHDYADAGNALQQLERIAGAHAGQYDCEALGVRVHSGGERAVVLARGPGSGATSALELSLEWRKHLLTRLAVRTVELTPQPAAVPARGADSVLGPRVGTDLGWYWGPPELDRPVPAWAAERDALSQWRARAEESGMRHAWMVGGDEMGVESSDLSRAARPPQPLQPLRVPHTLVCTLAGSGGPAALGSGSWTMQSESEPGAPAVPMPRRMLGDVDDAAQQ